MVALDDLFADLISEDESRAEAAACGLARLGETALSTLEIFLQSSIADRRWWAIRTLAQMKEPPSNWLINALDDPSTEVREAAALALTAHPTETAIPGLIHALSDPEEMLVTLAMNALIEVGKPAVPALLEAYKNALIKTRIQIMRSLAEIPDHRSIPLMLKASEEDSALVNYWAKEGLERLGLNMIYIKPE